MVRGLNQLARKLPLVRGASDEAVAHGRKWCLGARYQRGSTTPGALLSLARRGLVRPGVSTRHYTTATRVFRSDQTVIASPGRDLLRPSSAQNARPEDRYIIIAFAAINWIQNGTYWPSGRPALKRPGLLGAFDLRGKMATAVIADRTGQDGGRAGLVLRPRRSTTGPDRSPSCAASSRAGGQVAHVTPMSRKPAEPGGLAGSPGGGSQSGTSRRTTGTRTAGGTARSSATSPTYWSAIVAARAWPA